MIALLLGQLAARWRQALPLLLLSALACATAIGAVIYAAAVDRAAVAHELAAAHAAEQVVSVPVTERSRREPAAALAAHTDVLAQLPAFTPVTTVEINVQGLRPDAPASQAERLLARDGFCRQVNFDKGRCPVGGREVALPIDHAESIGRDVGDQLRLTPVISTDAGWLPDGPAAAVTVVGLFAAHDPSAPYWHVQDPLGQDKLAPAILTNRTALQALAHDSERIHADALLPEWALTANLVPELHTQLADAQRRVSATGLGPGIETGVPQLLQRITAHGDQARALLPVATASLLLLCWLAIYVVVRYGATSRRHEAGLVRLRGARAGARALLLVAESATPVLLGAAVGVPAVHLIIIIGDPASAVAGWSLTPLHLRAVGSAAIGALAAVVLAVGRQLVVPAGELLGGVPTAGRSVTRKRRSAQGLMIALTGLLAGASAVLAMVNLGSSGRELAGLMVAAPALLMLAAAVMTARTLRPLIEYAARWALRRGWLGAAMAGLHLARRPGARHLVVVLGLVLAIVGFGAAGAAVAADGRVAESQRALGAARVLDLAQVERGRLLHAVRSADPAGRYAMAAVAIPGDADDPARLAVDTTRLESVAKWSPKFGPHDVGRIAQLLRPAAPAPVHIYDGELVAEFVHNDRLLSHESVTVALRLASTRGGAPVSVSFGPLTDEQESYRAQVSGCASGCRLAGVSASTTQSAPFQVTWRSLRQPAGVRVPDEILREPDRWRGTSDGAAYETLQVRAGGAGLTLSHGSPEPGLAYRAMAVDAPYPLPVVSTTRALATDVVTNLDDRPVRIIDAVRVAGLPGLVNGGVLMDLEYAERSAREPGLTHWPQVWLADNAPRAVVDRLAAHGLVITGERQLASVQAQLDVGGAALALRFHLASAAAAVLVGLLALGAVVTVDRPAWRRSLGKLRRQGFPGGAAATALRLVYTAVVAAAAVTGMVAAAAAWLVTGHRLPLAVDPLLLASWPRWQSVLVPTTLVVTVLFGSAGAAAWWLRRSCGKRVGG